MAHQETYRPAWDGCKTWISYGSSYEEACSKHITDHFQAKRVYIIASGSLSRDTGRVKVLQHALGDKVVGTRSGMRPHTLWSEILEVVKEATKLRADLLVTLGAGSLTDGAKIIALVRRLLLSSRDQSLTIYRQWRMDANPSKTWTRCIQEQRAGKT